LQFGVETVQVEHEFTADLRRVATGDLAAPPPRLAGRASRAALAVLGAEMNGSARAVNTLLAGGARIGRVTEAVEVAGQTFEPGAFLIEGADATMLARLAREHSLRLGFLAASTVPARRALTQPRIGLYRSYRPNAMDEGWARFVLERYEFAFSTVRDAELRQGGLGDRYDCLVLAHQSAKDILEGNSARDYPPEYSGGIGEQGVANLRRFVEEGGTLVALDAACELAIEQLYLPVTNALAGLKSEQFYAPGALFRLVLDPAHPLGWGFEREVAALYLNGPAFELGSDGAEHERPAVVARYPLSTPLLSGWVLGPQHIAGKAAIVDVPVGQGRVYLFGFRPQFRAQMRGAYRLLFNALYASGLE
jgi:hypothetical protein